MPTRLLSALLSVACALPLQAQERRIVADTLHGQVLADPWRWLEEAGPRRTGWLREQDSIARATLAAVPNAARVHARVLELAEANSYSIPQPAGASLFYLELVGTTGERRIRIVDALGDRILPLPIAPAGSLLANFAPSPDAARLLVEYETERTGARSLHLVDLASNRTLLQVDAGSASHRPWRAGSDEFVFTRRTAGPDSVFVRSLAGTAATLVHVARTDDATVRAQVSDSGDWLIIEETGSSGRTLYLRARASGAAEALRDPALEYAGELDGRLVFRTTAGAPEGRVIALSAPGHAPVELFRAADGSVLEQAYVYGDRVLAYTFVGPEPRLEIRGRGGELLHQIELPIGLVWSDHLPGWPPFSGHVANRYAYLRSLNLSAPGIYRIDMSRGDLAPFRIRELGIDPEDFTTVLEWYTSDDGTRIPMFVARRKAQSDAAAPAHALVYAYGAYGFAPTPFFNAKYLTWLETGGVFAVPYLRGGGGMGSGWHEAGRGANKRNTVADLNSAARHLISRGYTTAAQIAVEGQGPGATVAATAVLQCPDLWAAAVLETPLTDPIRAQVLRGRPATEYGDASDPAAFRAMLEYSPLHNVGTRAYPPILLRTGDQDRVIAPFHTYKLYAALRESSPTSDTLLRITWNESHGFLRPVELRAGDWAADLVFILARLTPR